MSDLWFNIRFLYWHMQIRLGHVVPTVVKNDYFVQNPDLVRQHPIAICTFEPAMGWASLRGG